MKKRNRAKRNRKPKWKAMPEPRRLQKKVPELKDRPRTQPRPSRPAAPRKCASGADAYRIALRAAVAAAAAVVETIDPTTAVRVSRVRRNQPPAAPNNGNNVSRVDRARKATVPVDASASYPRKCNKFPSPTS